MESGEQPDVQALDAIEESIRDSRLLTGWEVAMRFAPLKSWEGLRARDLAARLAGPLGASKLREVLFLLNHRRFPDDANAFVRALPCIGGRFGPLAAIGRIEKWLGGSHPIPDRERADLLALKGWALATLRDFEPAHRAVEEAVGMFPEVSWILVQKSTVLEFEDRYEEALEVAREAVRLRPLLASGVSQLADCLIHLGLDDEAIAELERHHETTESAAGAARLVRIFSERDNAERALHFLDEFVRRSPLLEKDGLDWINRRRADMHYVAGEFERCLSYCDEATDHYHKRVSEFMRRPGALGRTRKRLDVPFVRQHSMTCAPATLASLAAFWGRAFDHLEIAESICYHGTPWHRERRWAEANGFEATEFRLTWETLVALIDRGIPFTLTTEAITNSHLQACIGYDDRQGVVLLRDPTERHYGEILIEGLLDEHPVTGPRCMLLLPESEAHRVADLELPDRALFDSFHAVAIALDAHDREKARAIVDAMPTDHPMTFWTHYRCAGYDRHPAAELRAIEPLIERFPASAKLRYARLAVLQRLQQMDGQRELIEAELQRKSCDPVFFSEMGELLMRDARQLSLADHYLRKAVRLRRYTAQVYASLGFCRWKERRFPEAARFRRVAACLEAAWEPYSAIYAETCRVIGSPAEGVAFLERRVADLGRKSAGPWQTLADELETQGRTSEATAVLDRGVAARPEDGELALVAGKHLVTSGERARGLALMESARGKVRHAAWQQEMASMRGFLGERPEAIAHWRESIALEPMSIAGYRALARLVAEENGVEETHGFLEEAAREHPEWAAMWCLKAEWDATASPAEAVRSLEHAKKLDPDSLWLRRELANRRSDAGDPEGAVAEAREAVEMDPLSAYNHGVLGGHYEQAGRVDEARAEFESALRLDVDYGYAAGGLVRLAEGGDAKNRALRFIAEEMRRQVSDGSIVPEYRSLAYRHIDPMTLLEQLRGFCEERPDLWQTWAARSQQATDMERPDEALESARELVSRFPLLPRAWVEIGRVHRAAGNLPAEIEAREKAVHLSPAWDWAARELATALESAGRYDDAVAVLERAVSHEPLSGANYGCLADLLRKLDRRGEAFEKLLECARRCPDYEWGWTALARWSREMKREEEVVAILRGHESSRGHKRQWWVRTAETFSELDRPDEALASTETGLLHHPGNIEILEKRAQLLGEAGRFDEALATCEEGLRERPINRFLRARKACVLMQAGKPNAAISLMKEIVEAEPDYVFGTSRLASWLSERERWEELRDLSARWTRNEPNSPGAFGYLGEAEIGLGNQDAARKALERAFALDPEYAFAGRRVLTYQIEAREFDAATETFRRLEHYIPTAEVAADGIELAIGCRDRDETAERTKKLLARQDASAGLLEWVGTHFEKVGWTKTWETLLDEAIAGSPTPAVLEAWVRKSAKKGKLWRTRRRLDRIRRADEELAATGWIGLLKIVGTEKRSEPVHRWTRRNRDWFHSRNDLWAAAGNALTNINDYRAASKWLEDWETRGDSIPCHAIFNYAVAVETLRGWKPAAKARETALSRFPAHDLSHALRSSVALQMAIADNIGEARRLGAEVERQRITEYYRGFLLLSCSIVAADEDRLTDSERDYRAALDLFNQWKSERGARTFIADTSEALAQRVPWAKGSARKLRRKWGRYQPAAKSNFAAYIVATVAIAYLLREIFAG